MNCRNCSEPLSGPYCSACGQKAVDLNRPIRELGHEALETITAFDSRVLRTFWPLVRRPGFLTLEYLEGRRARYVPPLKLYLFVSFLLFLTPGLTKIDIVQRGSSDGSTNGVVVTLNNPAIEKSESPKPEIPASAQAPDELEEAPEETATQEANSAESAASSEESDTFLGVDLGHALENESQLETNFVSRLAQVVFLLVPAFAALLKLVYIRSGRLYIQHLIFSLHVHTFSFLLIWLKAMLGLCPDFLAQIGEFLVLLILVYVVLAMRRVYGQGWLKTLLKSVVLWILYLILLLVTFFAAFVLAAAMA